MKAFLLLLIPFTLLAFTPVSDSTPERPQNVPESAIWVGGTDGGVFVKIEKNDTAYHGAVYAMETGAIWYEGMLIYSGGREFNIENPDVYDGWDGQNLYLTNGEKLSAPKPLP